MINKFSTQTNEAGTWWTIEGKIHNHPDINLDARQVQIKMFEEIADLLGFTVKHTPCCQKPKESTPEPTPTPQVKPELQLTAEPFNLISDEDFLESLREKFVKIRKEAYQILGYYFNNNCEQANLKIRKVGDVFSKVILLRFNDTIDVYNDIECTDYFHNALEYRKGNL